MNDNALRLIGYLIKSHHPWHFNRNHLPSDSTTAHYTANAAILKMIGSQR